MTQADRLCIKVALLPVAIYLVGLLGMMIARHAMGASPLPAGFGPIVPAISLLVTIFAQGAAHLLRVKFARASS